MKQRTHKPDAREEAFWAKYDAEIQETHQRIREWEAEHGMSWLDAMHEDIYGSTEDEIEMYNSLDISSDSK